MKSRYEADVRGWLDLKMVTGRYSSVLVDQLVQRLEQRSENVFTIYDEIEALENPSAVRATRTKPEAPLTRGVLRGLWHKHYFQAAFLAQNILNHWHSPKRLGILVDSIDSDATVSGEAKPSRLIYDMILGGYQARTHAGKATGEWIVFAKLNDVNYYLTLGSHGEDDAIAARVKACEAEFPELKGA